MTEYSSTLFEMMSHLQQLAEHEKSGLARELHDDLGGCLIAAVMDLSALAPGIALLGSHAQEKMLRVRRALAEAIEISRRITEQLRPTLLDNVGLFAALRWQLKSACAKAQVKCTEELPSSEPELTSRAAIALFRSAQEALIVGLERANVTELRLVGSLGARELSLLLTSNGGELPQTRSDTTTLMLESLRQRIRTLGGSVHMETMASGSMLLTIKTPMGSEAVRH